MIRRVKVKGYKRKIKGRTHRVKSHTKKKRKLGKKIKYRSIGTFQVAHDELGNFRGSKVIVKKSKSK